MSVLSSNTWYQLINNVQGNGSGTKAGCPYPSPGYCSVFISPFNTTTQDPAYLWQFTQVGDDSSQYVIRANQSGPNSFLGVELTNSTTYNTQIAAPRIQPFLDNTTTWTLGTWGDGTYYMVSSGNGSDWRLDLQENGSWLYFSSNLTTEDKGLHWSFESITQINDRMFSTIPSSASSTQATTITTATSMTVATSVATISITSASTTTQLFPQSTTSNTNHTTSTSHGLSSYSEAAIGASISAVAILIILVAAVRILIRRRRTGGHVYGSVDLRNDKDAPKPSSTIYELSGEEHPGLGGAVPLAELPGHNSGYIRIK